MPRSIGSRHHRRSASTGAGTYVVENAHHSAPYVQPPMIRAPDQATALQIAKQYYGEEVKVHKIADDDEELDEDRLAAPGEGGTRSLYAFYYARAPESGIFEPKARDQFAKEHVRAWNNENRVTRGNVRAWVRTTDEALATNDKRRISEAARSFPGAAGEVSSTPEWRVIQEQAGQADVAGQRIVQARNRRDYEREKEEIEGAVRNVDALTRD
jgi:hypothetical protein